jgi:hypothetical protein
VTVLVGLAGAAAQFLTTGDQGPTLGRVPATRRHRLAIGCRLLATWPRPILNRVDPGIVRSRRATAAHRRAVRPASWRRPEPGARPPAPGNHCS